MLAGLLLLLGTAPLATSTPLEPIRVHADATDVAASTYRVRAGDTLYGIGDRTGVGAAAIARQNRLDPPYRVRPGQRLAIPAGRYHRVRPGETGIAIGRAYGLDWSKVATLNHLEPPFQLRAGDRLVLPPPDAARTPTLEERAARFRLDLDDLVTGSEPALPRRGKPVPARSAAAPSAPPEAPVAPPPPGFAARFARPVEGRVLRRFGATAEGGRNDGIDFATDAGERIRAAAAGAVAYAGAYPAFGQVILVTHGGGWVTIYARVGKPLVKRGQAVTQGQPLAPAAGTLHFEIRQGRRPVDPMGLLGASPAPPSIVTPAKAGASQGGASSPASQRPQPTLG